ncbi:MAG: hypothetical protein MJZ34_05080 [Paludibacteraceae bacterium]|nr:hypothetical protein [Paludibacteraceae bacterium]
MKHIVSNDFIYRLMKGQVPSGKEGINVKLVPLNDNLKLPFDKRNIRTTADIPNYSIYDEFTNPEGVIEPLTAFMVEYSKTNEIRDNDVPTYIDSANSGSSAYSALYQNVLNTYDARYREALKVSEKAAYDWVQEKLRMMSGFYLVGNSDHLKYLANLCNAKANYNNTFNMYICDSAFQYDGSYPIGTFERPYNGILFGNFCTLKLQKDSQTNEAQKIYCNDYTNGLIGCLGEEGIVSDLYIEGESDIVCRKKISIETIKNESRNVYFGTLVGINYGLVRNIFVSAELTLKNFVPGVYCIGDKSETLRYYNNNDENYHYPDFFCVNASTNAVPYIGYFAHGQPWVTYNQKQSLNNPVSFLNFSGPDDSTYSASMNNPYIPWSFGIMPNVMHTSGLSLSGIQETWKPFKVFDGTKGFVLTANQYCNINSFSHLITRDEFINHGISTDTQPQQTPFAWYHEEDQYDNTIPFPSPTDGNTTQRMHQFSRNAYYIGGVIGMNRGTIINVMANKMVHRLKSTFVGFIGGIVGKEVGNFVSDIHLNDVYMKLDDDYIPDKVVFGDGDGDVNKMTLTYVEPTIYEYGRFCGEITTMSRSTYYDKILYDFTSHIKQAATEQQFLIYNHSKYTNENLYYMFDLGLCHGGEFAGVLQINGNDTECNAYTNVNINKNNVMKVYTNLTGKYTNFIGYQSVDTKINPSISFAYLLPGFTKNTEIDGIKDMTNHIFGEECCELPICEGVNRAINLPGVYLPSGYFPLTYKKYEGKSYELESVYYPSALSTYLTTNGRNYHNPAGTVLDTLCDGIEKAANSTAKYSYKLFRNNSYCGTLLMSNFIENHTYVRSYSLLEEIGKEYIPYDIKTFSLTTLHQKHPQIFGTHSKVSYNLAVYSPMLYEGDYPFSLYTIPHTGGEHTIRSFDGIMHYLPTNMKYSFAEPNRYDSEYERSDNLIQLSQYHIWDYEKGYRQYGYNWYTNSMIVGNKNLYWGGTRHNGGLLEWVVPNDIYTQINDIMVMHYNYVYDNAANGQTNIPFVTALKYNRDALPKPVLEEEYSNYQLYDINYVGNEFVYNGSPITNEFFSGNIYWDSGDNENNKPMFKYSSNCTFNTANNSTQMYSSYMCVGNCPSLKYVLNKFEEDDIYKVDAYLLNSKNNIDSILVVEDNGNVISIIDNIGQKLESGSFTIDFSQGFISF